MQEVAASEANSKERGTCCRSGSGVTRMLVGGAILALLVVDLEAIFIYCDDCKQLEEIAGTLISHKEPASLRMHRFVDYVVEEVPARSNDDYIIVPPLRFLRPTATQVIRGGGDCATKARALIVLLHHAGIPASKMALYNPSGESVHAVAAVETEKGTYIVDLLFGIVYEDETGVPVSLEHLASDPQVVRRCIDREVADGNQGAAKYPLNRYVFSDVRTINWHKSRLTAAVYAVLAETIGRERVNELKRPYLSEEPALMVLVLSFGTKGALLMLVLSVSTVHRFRRRRGRPDPANRALLQHQALNRPFV